MNATDPSKTRTFCLIGHAGDGKTTLADSILMAAGVTTRLGSVDDGSSFMNYLPEERARRISVSTSIASFERDGLLFNLLDTPGDANFEGELQGGVAAADAAVLVVSAQDGPKLGTQHAYKLAREAHHTVLAVANKMDTERADYDRVAGRLEEVCGTRVVKLHLPLHAGADYDGFVDLLTRRSHVFCDGSGRAAIGPVPADLADAVAEARLALVEAVAEADDTVLETYLEQGDLSDEQIRYALAKGIRQGSLLPLLSASAGRNIAGSAIVPLCGTLFYSPLESAPRRAISETGEQLIEARVDGPVVAYVFKSIADRYAGMLSICRVVEGVLHTDMQLVNARTGAKERISKMLRLAGEHTEDIKEMGPGGIVAIPKLRDTRTGDSLCEDRHPIAVIGPEPPRGLISFAVEAVHRGEEDKVFEALNRLVEEDTSLHLTRDAQTGEFLLTGLGQLHIEVTLDKLRRLFHVDIALKPPKVPYKETLRGRALNVEGKLKKQSGGRGQYGVCYLNVEPGPRGSGVVFHDEIVGGSIPRQFIPAVEKGIRETCKHGILAGYEITDIQVHCIDGKYHSVDSSEMAFKTAGSLALKAAFAEAKPALLEPIMRLSVTVPDEFVGDVMGNLNARRGRVSGVETLGHLQCIHAEVPMSEMLSYASDLTSLTGGQGSFSAEFSKYEEVPKEMQEKIVAEAAAARDGA